MPFTSKRLFIAINLPPGMKQELVAVSKFAQHPRIRWTPIENLHITLHFIGQTELNEISHIKEKISSIASETSCFVMTVEKLTVIMKNRNPAMIWAGSGENDPFTGLVLRLQNSLPGDSSKKPNPHITLARIRRGGELDIPPLPQIRKLSSDVRNIELMESVNRPAGTVYNVVESFSLRG